MRSSSAATVIVLMLAGCAKAPPAAPSPSPSPAAAPAPPAVVDPLQQLHADLDALIDRPGHMFGTWGVVVESIARDDRLYARNPRTLMVPASTMKVVTVGVASEAVGWDYRFQTQLLATGPIADGHLRGDLVIVGSGDPSTFGRPFDRAQGKRDGDALPPWVEALQRRGVTRIEGRIVGDDDDVDEPKPGFAWSWEDLGYAYGAAPGALNVGENVIALAVSPGNAPGLPTIVEAGGGDAGAPIVNYAMTVAADAPRNVWPEFRPGDSSLAIHGTVPVGVAPVNVFAAVGNPTLWFARVVRNDLLASGIDVTGPAVDADDLAVKPDRRAATALHVSQSLPLSEIAKPLMKDSINLYAESLLWLATGREGPRKTDAALDAARLQLEAWGIPKEGIQIVDGSGLSRRDVIAPGTLVAILRRFYDPSGTSPWMQTFPIAGRDGSLENRMKGTPAEANAIGKTGSMSNIRTLAGYVKTADGEPLAFAILANNFEGPASGVTATIDAIVVRLATFRRSPN